MASRPHLVDISIVKGKQGRDTPTPTYPGPRPPLPYVTPRFHCLGFVAPISSPNFPSEKGSDPEALPACFQAYSSNSSIW